MKSEMPYLGVSTVPLRQVCKEVFAGCHYEDSASWQKDVLEIWRRAKYREDVPLNLMIVTGAWWK